MTGPQDESSKSETVPAPVRPINPRTTFFRSVVRKIRKKLAAAEFSELLEYEADTDNENSKVRSAPMPDDQAMGRGPP